MNPITKQLCFILDYLNKYYKYRTAWDMRFEFE